MQIDVKTLEPHLLVKEIVYAIENGYIKTWKTTANNGNVVLTKCTGFWKNYAFVRLIELDDRLLITFENTERMLNDKVKGKYLSEITEILLVHFNEYFSTMETKYLNHKKLVMRN